MSDIKIKIIPVKPLSAKQRKAISETRALQKKWERAKKKCEDLRKLEDEHWQRYLPRLQKEYKALPRKNIGFYGDFIPKDFGGLDDTEVHLIDSAGQKLDFRVGPAFGKNGVLKPPAIWIGYQRRHMCSERQGDLLISESTWRALSKEIEARLKSYSSKPFSRYPKGAKRRGKKA